MYRGRIAPTPTGHLHLGHARTFWTAYQRAQSNNGQLLYRNEDLDPQRCKTKYRQAAIEDLKWLGIQWNGAPVDQSNRLPIYRAAFQKLYDGGHLFPCDCSRKDLREAITAPHSEDGDPIYPGTCRDRQLNNSKQELNWRFRIPEGKIVEFTDVCLGHQQFVAGRDFGDFPVWQKNGLPAYQLAVAVDDNAMKITEVVRGADLLLSTARQILLYQALNIVPPVFYHCELMCDENGQRLAKRHDALSLRAIRESGGIPNEIRKNWTAP
ncbi:MAG: tRNA glutamyl-Q(34) synthetase GluQRS [Verrucomicrobiales bacterium]|nr:tRNA glutamyl-Q(34) synthetase GluQRS [Verrucomicrobiales bacterium]